MHQAQVGDAAFLGGVLFAGHSATLFCLLRNSVRDGGGELYAVAAVLVVDRQDCRHGDVQGVGDAGKTRLAAEFLG